MVELLGFVQEQAVAAVFEEHRPGCRHVLSDPCGSVPVEDLVLPYAPTPAEQDDLDSELDRRLAQVSGR